MKNVLLKRSRRSLQCIMESYFTEKASSGRTPGAGQTDSYRHTYQVPYACAFSAAIKMADYALAVQCAGTTLAFQRSVFREISDLHCPIGKSYRL